MGRPRLYENDAAKLKAHRARHNVVSITVDLPADVVARLNEFIKFKDTTKNELIEKLIVTQLLRKR